MRMSPLTTQVQQGEEPPVRTGPLLVDGFQRKLTGSSFAESPFPRLRGASMGSRAPGQDAEPRSRGDRSQAHAWLLPRTARTESIDLAVASVARYNVVGKRWLRLSAVRQNTNTDKMLVSAAVALLSPCLNRKWSCSRFKKSNLQVPPLLTSTARSAEHP